MLPASSEHTCKLSMHAPVCGMGVYSMLALRVGGGVIQPSTNLRHSAILRILARAVFFLIYQEVVEELLLVLVMPPELCVAQTQK